MARLRLIIFLPVACTLLSGCLYEPVTLSTTEPTSVNSPYRRTEVRVEPMGQRRNLQICISDPAIKDVEFKNMKLLDAVITENGKETSLKSPDFTTYGVGVTYWFDLNRRGITGNDFGLRIITSLDGKTATITGNFSVGSHTKWVNVMDALDPGGK